MAGCGCCGLFRRRLSHPFQGKVRRADRCAGRPQATAAALGTVSTTVRDATTDQPVLGALVKWSFSEHGSRRGKRRRTSSSSAMTGSTDNRGRFAIQFPVADRKNGETARLTIERNGYSQLTTSVRVCPATNCALALMLTPAEKFGTVEGQVTDPATGRGIPNANIAILIGRFPQIGLSATTGPDGKYAIRHVGFFSGLTLQATLTSPPCVSPITRRLDVHQSTVIENFSLPVSTSIRWRCEPLESGDLSSGATAVELREAPGTPLELATQPGNVAGSGGNRKVAWPEISRRKPVPAGPAHDPPLPDDSSIQWQPATVDAIQGSDTLNTWNSGHINDILKIGPFEALVASQTGGVWSLEFENQSNAGAIPLSTGWGSTAMTSLAQGPDGVNHVYAGTYDSGLGNPGGVLWETDTSAGLPLLSWVAHTTNCTNINHVLVIAEFRRVVLACDTGVWWSTIPSAPAAHGAYDWQAAQPGSGVIPGLLQGGFGRLAKAPGWGAAGGPPTEGTIAVSASVGTAPEQFMYWGGWTNGQLVLNVAYVDTGLVDPSAPVPFGRSTLAACPLDPHTMYAVAADASNVDVAAVWQSSDGGQNWAMVNLPPSGTGGQGWYNQALAVSPADCNTFAVGWEYATFVSFDGGNSYPMTLNGVASGCSANVCQLHDDYHALLFDPGDPQTLWIGTDGGLASAGGVVNNGTPTFASFYNEHLWDLQFYHTAPSFRAANLVAGPLQDNAVVWSVLPNSWTRLPGSSGDGAYTEFAGVAPTSSSGGPPGSNDSLVWDDHTAPAQQSIWNGGFSPNPPTIPVSDAQNSRDPVGLPESPNWNVRSPSYSNTAGELMYLVKGVNSNVYGLFANSDGSDLHWGRASVRSGAPRT